MSEQAAQTVLIVDDDSEILELFRSEWGKQYNLLQAHNGEEGLMMALLHKPDLIISDINMPQLNGWDFCYLLRQIPSTKAIPFLFLTCRTDLPDRVKSLSVGADDFVTKPFFLEEINKRIKALAGRMRNRKKLVEGLSVFEIELNTLLLDLLDFLRVTHRSGIVEFSRMGQDGFLVLSNGNILEAEFDDVTGEQALRMMLQNGAGEVSFKEQHTPKQGTSIVDWNMFVASLFPPESS